jgi:hypothetical protein
MFLVVLVILSLTDGFCRVDDKGACERRRSSFGIVTVLVKPEKQAYNDFSVYQNVSLLVLPLFHRYAKTHNYEFVVNHGSAVGKVAARTAQSFFHVHRERGSTSTPSGAAVQPYWRKIAALKEVAKTKSWEWILYTDIDVVVVDEGISLDHFVLGHEEKLFVGAGECRHPDVARSGFFLLKNDNRTSAFLDEWLSLFAVYEHAENPDQLALEEVLARPKWRGDVFLHHWSIFHSYDICPQWMNSFSVHFPGSSKLGRVARVVAWKELVTGKYVLPGLSLPVDPIRKNFDPNIMERCSSLVASSHVAALCASFEKHDLSQMDKVLHVPADIALHWTLLNRAFLVYSYTDADISGMVQGFFSSSLEDRSLTRKLWQMVVLYTFGGYAVAESLEPPVNLLEWKVRLDDHMVVSFSGAAIGAVPGSPVIGSVLHEAVEALHFLASSALPSVHLSHLKMLVSNEGLRQRFAEYSCLAGGCVDSYRAIVLHNNDNRSERQSIASCNITCPQGPILGSTSSAFPCTGVVQLDPPVCMTLQSGAFSCVSNTTGNFNCNTATTLPIGASLVTFAYDSGGIHEECNFVVVVDAAPGVSCSCSFNYVDFQAQAMNSQLGGGNAKVTCPAASVQGNVSLSLSTATTRIGMTLVGPQFHPEIVFGESQTSFGTDVVFFGSFAYHCPSGTSTVLVEATIGSTQNFYANMTCGT